MLGNDVFLQKNEFVKKGKRNEREENERNQAFGNLQISQNGGGTIEKKHTNDVCILCIYNTETCKSHEMREKTREKKNTY